MSSPHPHWKPGDLVKPPFQKMTELNPATMDVLSLYKIIIGAIVPRPIALVSTQSKDGLGNLAPFSYFNGVSSSPPCLSISIARKPNGDKKDTLLNIEETGEFVVNSANEWLIEPLNFCSGPFERNENEMDLSGLHSLPSIQIKPPRVKESAIQLECKLYGKLEVGSGLAGSSTVVIGEIVWIHVAEKVYKDGKILLDQLKPISRLAGLNYGRTTGVFELKRPKGIKK